MTPASPSSVARTAVRLPAATDGKAGGAGLTPALLLAGLGLAVAIAGYYAPPTVGEMAVVFPPGTSEAATFSLILKAGGHFVGPTRFSNIAIAYADTPGFAARVRAEGGLFTLAAHGLCGPISSIQGNTA